MRDSEFPDIVNDTTKRLRETVLQTHNGQALSPKQDKFITLYIEYDDPGRAAKEAGYAVRDTFKDKDKQWRKKGLELLRQDYIQNEIAHRLEVFKSSHIADTEEALQFLTAIMRGEEKDQFGMDVSASDRMNAAKEIIKWNKDMEKAANTTGAQTVRLVLERNY